MTSTELSPAQKLDAVIEQAVSRGWKPADHDGQHLVGFNPEPGLLRYTTEQLILDTSFLALILLNDFSQALWGGLAMEKLAQILAASDNEKMDVLYELAMNEQFPNITRDVIEAHVLSQTDNHAMVARLWNAISHNGWLENQSGVQVIRQDMCETVVISEDFESFRQAAKRIIGRSPSNFGIQMFELFKGAVIEKYQGAES